MNEDSPPPSQSKPRFSRKFGCLLVGIGLPALVLLPLVATYIVWTVRGNRRAEKALAKIRAAAARLQATRRHAHGELGILLGLEGDAVVMLDGAILRRERYLLEDLLEGSADRPDLLALRASSRAAEADLRQARGYRWPDLGLGVEYEREEGADIIKGAVALSLPLLDHGQGAQAEALARLEGDRQALEIGGTL